MNKFFLVTLLKTEKLPEFQTNMDTSLISWTPVVLSEKETESDIVSTFKAKDFTVLGIESMELLKEKLGIIEQFEKELKENSKI